MKSVRRIAILAIAGAMTIGALSGCSSSAPAASGGKVTLKVAIDAGLDKGARAAFDKRAAQFEKANPNVTIDPQEYTWTGTTFTAELAGGTVPDVFTIPFTDGRGLIQRKQIADVSSQIAQLPYAKSFNPNIAVEGEDAKGSMWAVPIAAYGQGLHYNRTLFTKAGLDPNKPPTTWAEIRTDAKKIADATGVAGYAQMTTSNTGGWILTTVDNALGGRLETTSGSKTTATIDTAQMKSALQMLHTMRWTDNSMGSNFLYDWAGINQAFASGQIGMYVSGGGNYGGLFTQNAMKPADYGVTIVPLSGKTAGVLGGGTLAAVSAKATKAEQDAGVKWIDFFYIQKLTTKAAALADAKASFDSGQPVGAPQLPVFDKATYDKSQLWVKQYVNVPVKQMTPYTDHIFTQALIPEPSVATQAVYGLLDPVVQTVLTNKSADIPSLLSAAQTAAQALVDKN